MGPILSAEYAGGVAGFNMSELPGSDKIGSISVL